MQGLHCPTPFQIIDQPLPMLAAAVALPVAGLQLENAHIAREMNQILGEPINQK